jgi:hypothetical protein
MCALFIRDEDEDGVVKKRAPRPGKFASDFSALAALASSGRLYERQRYLYTYRGVEKFIELYRVHQYTKH